MQARGSYPVCSAPSSSQRAAQACQPVCTSRHCCLQELSHAQEALTWEQQRSQQQALEVGQLTKALAEATAKAAHQARQHAAAAQELEDVSFPGSSASESCRRLRLISDQCIRQRDSTWLPPERLCRSDRPGLCRSDRPTQLFRRQPRAVSCAGLSDLGSPGGLAAVRASCQHRQSAQAVGWLADCCSHAGNSRIEQAQQH